MSPMDDHASALRKLHVPGDPVLLPNAWDADTARLVVAAGFPVVATSSGAVAASLGYPDHQGAPADEMLAAAARITAAVDVPVTVDAEAGYSLDPTELVDRLLAMGAAGCNLEDTDHATGRLRAVKAQAAYLRAIRDAAGQALVINARVDVFVESFPDPSADQSTHLPDALDRAAAYLDAGADCVYPILLRSADLAAEFVASVRAPVNLLAHPMTFDPAAARAAGAARVSLGIGLWRAQRTWLGEQLAELARGRLPA
ncbi:MAG TPA: isocitrate lyase/phosphoenolpyruvate mutase family protein [Sporichthya sp.]|nr:isocitrate lyase/phosphoenolpyruvate mutase family protein [Sporichthya sp.]